MSGKGDTPRPVNPEVYGQNYDDIFRKDKQQISTENDNISSSDDSDKRINTWNIDGRNNG